MPDPAPTDPTDPQAAKTVELTEKDLKDAARLLRLLAELGFAEQALPAPFPSAGDPAGGAPDRQSLIAKARILLGARRARERYFHRDLFGEPAWEILLALYIVEQSGARFTTSKLAEWIEAPLSTVVRWIRALEEKSLVGRVDHPNDKRIVFIRLLKKGRKALDDYLGAMPG